MFALCVVDQRQEELEQWLYLAWGYGSSIVYTRGAKTNKAVSISSLDELPDQPLIIIQPTSGTNISGVESLVDFIHPDDAIYVFGGSDHNLVYADFAGRVMVSKVYIPQTDNIELHAPLAGSIVLYDRYLKRGDFG